MVKRGLLVSLMLVLLIIVATLLGCGRSQETGESNSLKVGVELTPIAFVEEKQSWREMPLSATPTAVPPLFTERVEVQSVVHANGRSGELPTIKSKAGFTTTKGFYHETPSSQGRIEVYAETEPNGVGEVRIKNISSGPLAVMVYACWKNSEGEFIKREPAFSSDDPGIQATITWGLIPGYAKEEVLSPGESVSPSFSVLYGPPAKGEKDKVESYHIWVIAEKYEGVEPIPIPLPSSVAVSWTVAPSLEGKITILKAERVVVGRGTARQFQAVLLTIQNIDVRPVDVLFHLNEENSLQSPSSHDISAVQFSRHKSERWVDEMLKPLKSIDGGNVGISLSGTPRKIYQGPVTIGVPIFYDTASCDIHLEPLSSPRARVQAQ